MALKTVTKPSDHGTPYPPLPSPSPRRPSVALTCSSSVIALTRPQSAQAICRRQAALAATSLDLSTRPTGGPAALAAKGEISTPLRERGLSHSWGRGQWRMSLASVCPRSGGWSVSTVWNFGFSSWDLSWVFGFHVSVSVSAQGGIVALGKAYTRSAPSLSSLPKVALETVPIFVWLNTDRSQPWSMDCRPRFKCM